MIDQEAVSFGLRNFDVMPAVGKNKEEEVSAKKKDDYLFSATSIDMREKHANWKFFLCCIYVTLYTDIVMVQGCAYR